MDPFRENQGFELQLELELEIEELESKIAPDGGETVLPLASIRPHF